MTAIGEFLVTASTTLGLIGLAEIGDKSQLVCMSLAARHRPRPVLAGAVLAFALLNLLAVVFGAALADWFPPWLVAAGAAVLFAVFGFHALYAATQHIEAVPERRGRSVMLSALLLIFMAELGDKTQLTVAALAGTNPALPVWLGATLALTLTSALGVLAGRALLQRLPIQRLHRLGGLFFLVMAALATWRALAVA